MLEQSPEMTKFHPTDITTHETRIQDFEWRPERYDCICGCWCFGYLNQEERQNAIVGITNSLKDNGYFVIFEPILEETDTAQEKLHHDEEQQLYIRREEFYDKFFADNDFEVKHK